MTDIEIANRLLRILECRKGWNYFFSEWESNSRTSLKRELGREVRKIVKELTSAGESGK